MLPLALTLLAALAGEPNFPTRVFRIAGETDSIEIVDLNRDGAQDLLVVQNFELAWLSGDGAGEFVDRGVVPGSSGWRYFDFADADGDGWVDALGWRPVDNHLIFVPGDGNGGFATPQALGSFDGWLAQFKDLDGDGDLDAVAWDTSTRTLRTHLRTSAGYVPGPVTPIPSLFVHTFALGDFDHDHHVDIALSGGFNSPPWFSFSVLHGDGSGAFGQRSSLTVEYTLRLEAADLDGDGFEELLHQRGVDVVAFHHLGGRHYGRISLIPTAGGTMRVADADSDGDMDIAAIAAGGPTLHLNDGSGRFHKRRPVWTHRAWDATAFGDLDGDGHADLASSIGPELICVTFLKPANSLGVSVGRTKDTYAAAAADVDGDGVTDLMFQRAGFIEFARGDGHGQFAPAVQSDIEPFDFLYGLTLADVDSDGDLDAFGDAPANRILATLNDGTGRFGRPLALPLTNGNRPVWGDFDGDGRNDALVAVASFTIAGELHVHRGLPGVEFAEAAVTSFNFGTVPVVGDFDGDGRAEAILWSPGALVRLAWGASGALEPVGSIPCPNWPRAILADDVDADGELDLLWVTCNGWIQCALGDGTGNFAAPLSTPLPLAQWENVDRARLLHVDRDGHLDLLVDTMDTQMNPRALLCSGLGNARFASPIELAPWIGCGLMTDFNGDDRADLVLDNRGFARPVVILQD